MTTREDDGGVTTGRTDALARELADARARRAALLEPVFSQSPVGVGVFDELCRYVDANAALQAIVGLSVEELRGRPIADVLPAPLGQQAAQRLRHVMSTGEPLVNIELSGRTPATGPGERPRSFLVSYFRLADSDGRVVGAASIVSDVTEERATRDALRLAGERMALLGQASDALTRSLDLSVTLASFADLVVPSFADHCVVDLVRVDGRLERVALRNPPRSVPEPRSWTPVGSVVVYPEGHPSARALRTGEGSITDISPATFDYATVAPSAESAEYARAVGVRSVVTVPLRARGAVVGVASFAASVSGRRYGPDDLVLAMQLADRAAVAIDNALVYGREQRHALTLQESLLPERVPQAPGLRAAARYQPAADGGHVGGDWYDVVPLTAGRVAIVLGDVMGRGLPAAALMGQLRAAIRAYAAQDLPPADVLTFADELVRGMDETVIATCTYAAYDPRDGELVVANAGHVPPMLLGGEELLIEASGPPLGAGGQQPYDQVVIDFAPGQLLALYSDGLVERRGEDIDVGIRRLQDALRAAAAGPADLDEVCMVALGAAASSAPLAGTGRGPVALHDDDVAVLVVRPDETTRPSVAVLALDPVAEDAGRARAFCREALAGWGLADVVDETTLVVSELVTNALRHTGTDAELRLSHHPEGVVVEVRDGEAAPPRWRLADSDDEGGRGLLLVATLSEKWGARPLPTGGKAVWCRMATR